MEYDNVVDLKPPPELLEIEDAWETCLTCGDSMAKPDILSHISSHILDGQTDCSQCNFVSNHAGDLLDHMTIHYGLKTHVCEVEGCGKAYHRKHSLVRHTATQHSTPSSFQRSIPDDVAFTDIPSDYPVVPKPGRQKNHSNSNEVLQRDKRSCQICGEEMILLDLLTHIRTHINNYQVQCQLCLHIYANTETLREHMHTHYGLEPHKCAVCHKTYSLKQSALNHIIRNHARIKPLDYYICMIPSSGKGVKKCYYQSLPSPTSSSSRLNIAPVVPKKVTTKKKSFHCTFCSWVFTTKFSLQRHEAKQHAERLKQMHRNIEDSSVGMNSESSEMVDTSCSLTVENSISVTFAEEYKWYRCSSCLVFINDPQDFLHHILTHPEFGWSENVLVESLVEFFPTVCVLEKIGEPETLSLESDNLDHDATLERSSSFFGPISTVKYTGTLPELKMEEKKFQIVTCPICSELMYRPALLQHIQDMHNHLEPSICTICERMFSGKYFLQQHVQHMHSGNSSTEVLVEETFAEVGVPQYIDHSEIPFSTPALPDDNLTHFQQVENAVEGNSGAEEGPDQRIIKLEMEQFPQIILGI